MKRRWPSFALVEEAHDHAVWVGSLAGLECSYRLMVELGLPDYVGVNPLCAEFPIVRVLSPRLVLKPHAVEEAPLPHVYFEAPDITLSPLCLFDPDEGEWSHNDLIAHTTLPWAADWLACYEGWLATGRWHGGGRHATSNKTENMT
jgi:hypothetical protein